MTITPEHKHLLDLAYPRPPKNVPELLEKTCDKYPHTHMYQHRGKLLVGCVTILTLAEHIYGISCMAVHPDFQNTGIGSRLMDKIHALFDGIIILRSGKAGSFYTKHDYIPVYMNTYVKVNNKTINW